MKNAIQGQAVKGHAAAQKHSAAISINGDTSTVTSYEHVTHNKSKNIQTKPYLSPQ